jgi:putative spermidine/putrescine transport system permease protein
VSAPRRRRLVTVGLSIALGVSALAPLLLLGVWSLGRDWFYPLLWPPRLTLDGWRSIVTGRARLGTALATSLALAIANGALATILAFPVGRAMARLRGWRRHLASAAVFLPIAAPPIGLGIGLQYSLLSLGLGATFAGVLLAHLVPSVGFLSLYFLGIFTAFDARIEEEARSLGASSGQVLRRITLPLLRRPMSEAFLLGLLISWSQYALTQLVGGGLVHTLPLEVFAYVRAGQDRYAATGALLLVLPALGAVAAARIVASRAEVPPL